MEKIINSVFYQFLYCDTGKGMGEFYGSLSEEIVGILRDSNEYKRE